MSKGVVLIANNNGTVDYVKQAIYCAGRIKKYLNLPVTLITDSEDYVSKIAHDVFDKVISTDYRNVENKKFYFDGALSHKILMFKNYSRSTAYHLSPYDKTILMDTDYILSNSILNNCFDMDSDLMMYKESVDIAQVRDEREFEYISDKGIDFYWATVVYFEKNEKNDIYFNLIDHIEENWNYYQSIYDINADLFRNDFAFSIAIHIMNGFQSNNEIVDKLPGKHYYTTDRDVAWKINNDYLMFLVQKKNFEGQYTAISTSGLNVHIMNKFSLGRIIDNE
jgi:hypothetical protein